jgi:N utilization substance protein B
MLSSFFEESVAALAESPVNPSEVSYDDLSRREVRSLIFHMLYAADSFEYQNSLESIVANFNYGFNLTIPMDCEVVTVASHIIESREVLDQNIKPLLANWRFDRIGCCTKLILRFALWELREKDTPPSIVINEAIELAKCFAEKDAYKFVNGILDEALKVMGKAPVVVAPESDTDTE